MAVLTSWKKGWRIAYILERLFPKTIRAIVQDEITEAIHPEFGWIWKADSSIKSILDSIRDTAYLRGVKEAEEKREIMKHELLRTQLYLNPTPGSKLLVTWMGNQVEVTCIEHVHVPTAYPISGSISSLKDANDRILALERCMRVAVGYNPDEYRG